MNATSPQWAASLPPRIEVTTQSGLRFELPHAVSYQSQRSLENPVSSASLTFWGDSLQGTARSDLEGRHFGEVLSLYDLVRVEFRGRDGREWNDGLFFLEDMVFHNAQTSQGPQRRTSLRLVSLGEALMRYTIFWHPWLVERSNIAGVGFLNRSKGQIPQGRPDEVVSTILRTFLNDKYEFQLADGRKLHQALGTAFEEIPDSLALVAFSALGAEGSLWDTLKRYADQPFNELFVDMPHERGLSSPLPFRGPLQTSLPYGQQEALYLRQTPFHPDRWDALFGEPSWGFLYDGSDRMAEGESWGPAASDIANFFWVSGKIPYGGNFGQAAVVRESGGGELPRYDQGSIRRFGLRRLEKQTEYVHLLGRSALRRTLTPEQQQRGKTRALYPWQLLVERTKALHLWFGYPGYWRGTLTTAGRIGGERKTGARIGGILHAEELGRMFYITGITQSWNFPGPWTTTLTLSRGHKPDALRTWWLERKDKAISTAEEKDSGIAFV